MLRIVFIVLISLFGTGVAGYVAFGGSSAHSSSSPSGYYAAPGPEAGVGVGGVVVVGCYALYLRSRKRREARRDRKG